MSWFEVEVSVAETQREAVTNRLFELGAQGVDESSAGGLRAYFEGEQAEAVARELRVYFDSLAAMSPREPKGTVVTRPVRDEKWADKYKEFYFAQKLTRTFFLKPKWDEATQVPDGMIPIVLDPGQAFGTGLHPSTVMTLHLFEHAFNNSTNPAALRLMDVGTGSGILAIAAAKLGVKQVDANDVDTLAVEVARENAEGNHCAGIRFSAEPLSRFEGPYDVVLSNILLQTHRELVGEYRRLLPLGGVLILSGLLGAQKEEILAVVEGPDFVLEVTETQAEWMALAFRRR